MQFLFKKIFLVIIAPVNLNSTIVYFFHFPFAKIKLKIQDFFFNLNILPVTLALVNKLSV